MKETRDELLYRLGRESAADEAVSEREELASLQQFCEREDTDLMQHSLGRLSTLYDGVEEDDLLQYSLNRMAYHDRLDRLKRGEV